MAGGTAAGIHCTVDAERRSGNRTDSMQMEVEVVLSVIAPPFGRSAAGLTRSLIFCSFSRSILNQSNVSRRVVESGNTDTSSSCVSYTCQEMIGHADCWRCAHLEWTSRNSGMLSTPLSSTRTIPDQMIPVNLGIPLQSTPIELELKPNYLHVPESNDRPLLTSIAAELELGRVGRPSI